MQNDAEWEEHAWAKLLNSNQDILVLMQRLHEKNLITQDMIQMATLPTKPPPRNGEADSKPISMADSHQVPQSATTSMMGGYQSPSMMGGAPPFRSADTDLTCTCSGLARLQRRPGCA